MDTPFDMLLAARHLHRTMGRSDCRQCALLPAPLVGRLLGRAVPHNGTAQYLASTDDDSISFGTTLVWKSGGRAVIAACLAQTSTDDLDYMDYVEELMWRGHVANQRKRGYIIPLDGAPTAWRNGVQLDTGAYAALIEREEAERGQLAAQGLREGVWR